MSVPPQQPPPGGPVPGHPFGMEPPDHPQAMTVLILGILGLSMVPFTAPFAWYMGTQALREIDAQPSRYGRRDWVNVGRILGMVGTLLLGVVVLFGCLMFAPILLRFGGTVLTGL